MLASKSEYLLYFIELFFPLIQVLIQSKMEHIHTALLISDLPFMIGIHPPPIPTLQNKKLTIYGLIF